MNAHVVKTALVTANINAVKIVIAEKMGKKENIIVIAVKIASAVMNVIVKAIATVKATKLVVDAVKIVNVMTSVTAIKVAIVLVARRKNTLI